VGAPPGPGGTRKEWLDAVLALRTNHTDGRTNGKDDAAKAKERMPRRFRVCAGRRPRLRKAPPSEEGGQAGSAGPRAGRKPVAPDKSRAARARLYNGCLPDHSYGRAAVIWYQGESKREGGSTNNGPLFATR